MGNYFCGWYYRCQSDAQTLAIIPSVHKSRKTEFCMLQLITDSGAFPVQLPYSDFQYSDLGIRIGNNRFGKDGIDLDIQGQDVSVTGSLRFGALTPIRYDIMGPFRYVPFMQCRHSVHSMRHRVDGTCTVNGTPYVFQNGIGYMEGDRGSSFPEKYVWTQCSFPEGSLMLSVADVPVWRFQFTGIIGVVLIHGKEYRLASYLGAQMLRVHDGEVVIRQGRLRLTVKQMDAPGHPLRAPVNGDMVRTIHEHPSCRVYYCFQDGARTLLELEAKNAAFEYEF